MKIILLILATTTVFAQPKNTQMGCYKAMDPSAKAGKPRVPKSDAAWNRLLEDRIKKARVACKDENLGECLAEFIENLRSCEGVGDRNLQRYIADLKRAAEVHATHPQKTVETGNVKNDAAFRE